MNPDEASIAPDDIRCSELVLWHNPDCSKSRAVKEILIERGVPHRERRYLEDFPEAEELIGLAAKVGRALDAMVRKSEDPWTEMGFDRDHPDSAALSVAMSKHPILLERPILEDSDSGIVARPPETVLPWLMARGHLPRS